MFSLICYDTYQYSVDFASYCIMQIPLWDFAVLQQKQIEWYFWSKQSVKACDASFLVH